MNECRVAGKAELAQDPGTVGAHRAGRQAHLTSDLADLLARGEQPHHAVLAVREFLVQCLLRVARALGGENFRQRGRDVFAAVRDFAHGGGQLLRRAVLRDVAGAAGAQHARAVHIFRMHAEDQHRLTWKFLLDVAEEVEAAAPGHGEIENRHVPFDLARELECLVAVGGFTDYGGGRIGREHLLQPVAHNRVIVGYENSHFIPLLAVVFPVGEKYRHDDDAWPSYFPLFLQGCSTHSTALSVFARHVDFALQRRDRPRSGPRAMLAGVNRLILLALLVPTAALGAEPRAIATFESIGVY